MKRVIFALVLIAVLAVAISTVRIIDLPEYDYYGFAWDWGGFDVKPQPSIFICPASVNYETGERWNNPLAPLFPELVTDC